MQKVMRYAKVEIHVDAGEFGTGRFLSGELSGENSRIPVFWRDEVPFTSSVRTLICDSQNLNGHFEFSPEAFRNFELGRWTYLCRAICVPAV